MPGDNNTNLLWRLFTFWSDQPGLFEVHYIWFKRLNLQFLYAGTPTHRGSSLSPSSTPRHRELTSCDLWGWEMTFVLPDRVRADQDLDQSPQGLACQLPPRAQTKPTELAFLSTKERSFPLLVGRKPWSYFLCSLKKESLAEQSFAETFEGNQYFLNVIG